MFSFLLAIIYLCFISLGLPDSLLGAAWPTIYQEFNVPMSYAGIISVIVSLATIISSLLSDKLTKRFTPGLVTVVSIILSAISLLGFALSNSFWMLLIFAVPYGFGAGGIDACLNNYVALHYKSKHMSWLHAMWGLGTVVSPYIMGYALTGGTGWNQGYLIVSLIQFALSIIVVCSLPKWKKNTAYEVSKTMSLSFKQILLIPGAVTCFIMFFCYCALEQSAMLWASSYLVKNNHLQKDVAAMLASMFCIGITLGRIINGFLTYKLNDKKLIRLGMLILVIAVGLLFIPLTVTTIIGFVLIGLGCAPIYPSIIHSTPDMFGSENSQAMIGVQMACAYSGVLLMPPLFGLIADYISISLLPIYLLIILILMITMNELTNKLIKRNGA
jgi:MFS family permease